MTDHLDRLRARSDELEPEEHDEAVEVYEAILRLKVGDLLATRGLALALVGLGEFDRAEEVVQEALELHPDDGILLKRLGNVESTRRWVAKEAAGAGGRRRLSTTTRPASTWIKAIHYDGGGWGYEVGEEMWLSDPGQRDADGKRLYTAAKEPWGKPSWRVGEQSGVYFGGTHRVPVLVEITVGPVFDPAFVAAAHWATGDDGERWPWVTWVRVLQTVAVDAAPSLEHLGIDSSSMQQRARLRTDPLIHGRLVQALKAAS